MNSQSAHIRTLFLKYSTGVASIAEVKELFALIAEGNHDEEITSYMQEQMVISDPEASFNVNPWKNTLIKIQNQIQPQTKKVKLWPRIAAAAAVVLLASVALLLYVSKSKSERSSESTPALDIAAGKNTATLTLASGKKIILSDAVNGELAKESGVVITKGTDGQLIYEVKDQKKSESVEINILTTSKGETYKVKLPDGTAIWLNSASSIKYPTSFAFSKSRNIELLGEAYFEVAKDEAHPFIVKADRQEIEVLGTHFNISSYKDEVSSKTTLLEGSVKISNHILKPGEQAIQTEKNFKIIKADTTMVVAWKNGLFKFYGTPLNELMRQVARWYNIEVVYQGDVSDRKFYGEIERSYSLNEFLKVLEMSKIHFEIEAPKSSGGLKKLVVMP